MRSCIYRGQVMHHRRRPVDHRFVYRVFSLYVDLDEFDEIDRHCRLLSTGCRDTRPGGSSKLAVLGLRAEDHGARDGSPLRPWVAGRLDMAGLDFDLGRVMLLAMPRIFGFVFNPLSIYFCHDQEDRLRAVVYEVKNTFGDQHGYALPVDPGRNREVFDHSCSKAFFVSPFIDMGGCYRFRSSPPDERFALVIRETDDEGCFFVASHTGERRPLTDRQLFSCLASGFLMNFVVIVGIHWEALKLWLKGAPFYSPSARPRIEERRH